MFKRLSSILFCLFSLPFSWADVNTTVLLENALTLKEFDQLSFTDILTEYGDPITPEEGQELFEAAIEFGFTHATNNEDEFFTYVACATGSTMEGISLAKRKEAILQASIDAGIEPENFLFGSSFGTTSDRSCWIVRVPGNSLAMLFSKTDTNGNAIEVTPYLPAMKISQNTLDTANLRLAGNQLSDITDKAGEGDELGLLLQMCPGVFNRDGIEVSEGEVKEKLRNAIKDGEEIKEASWQYNYVSGNPEKQSNRMALWHSVVDEVVVQGGDVEENHCYNAIVEHLIYTPDSLVDGFAITFDTINTTELGFDTDEERNNCVAYIIHSVALQQDVCSIEPTAIVVSPPAPDLTSSGMSMMLTGKIGGMATSLLLGATAFFSLM